MQTVYKPSVHIPINDTVHHCTYIHNANSLLTISLRNNKLFYTL